MIPPPSDRRCAATVRRAPPNPFGRASRTRGCRRPGRRSRRDRPEHGKGRRRLLGRAPRHPGARPATGRGSTCWPACRRRHPGRGIVEADLLTHRQQLHRRLATSAASAAAVSLDRPSRSSAFRHRSGDPVARRTGERRVTGRVNQPSSSPRPAHSRGPVSSVGFCGDQHHFRAVQPAAAGGGNRHGEMIVSREPAGRVCTFS